MAGWTNVLNLKYRITIGVSSLSRRHVDDLLHILAENWKSFEHIKVLGHQDPERGRMMTNALKADRFSSFEHFMTTLSACYESALAYCDSGDLLKSQTMLLRTTEVVKAALSTKQMQDFLLQDRTLTMHATEFFLHAPLLSCTAMNIHAVRTGKLDGVSADISDDLLMLQAAKTFKITSRNLKVVILIEEHIILADRKETQRASRAWAAACSLNRATPQIDLEAMRDGIIAGTFRIKDDVIFGSLS
jgi:hypothetical protein